MKVTTNYDLFSLRDDNRKKIERAHVLRLKNSLEKKNMLGLKPIIVNEKMEILDGQHRYLAAKELGLEICYEVQRGSTAQDIITLNVSKSWGIEDYLNFYCVNGYQEYQKLEKFSREKNISLQSALCLSGTWKKEQRINFKEGNYKFLFDIIEEKYQLALETIDKIKKFNGFSSFTRSSRFWKALMVLISHEDFNADKWFKNMDKFIDHFVPKANSRDYLKCILNIYNYQNTKRINIDETETFTSHDHLGNNNQREQKSTPKKNGQFSFLEAV